MDEIKTVTDQINGIKEEICDKYCKFIDEVKVVNMDDATYEKWLDEHCEKCPLNRL